MGWELRGGRLYYYRTTRGRVDGRPVKRYFGRGELAEATALACTRRDELRRAEREAIRTAYREQWLPEHALDELDQAVRRLCEAVLLTSGYYCHKREWRRRGSRKRIAG